MASWDGRETGARVSSFVVAAKRVGDGAGKLLVAVPAWTEGDRTGEGGRMRPRPVLSCSRRAGAEGDARGEEGRTYL